MAPLFLSPIFFLPHPLPSPLLPSLIPHPLSSVHAGAERVSLLQRPVPPPAAPGPFSASTAVPPQSDIRGAEGQRDDGGRAGAGGHTEVIFYEL